MMNDYRAIESTGCEGEEVCVSQMSTSEILKETRQELTETISILRGISFSLNGKEINEKKKMKNRSACMTKQMRYGVWHLIAWDWLM